MNKDSSIKKTHKKNTSAAMSSYQNHLGTHENMISEYNETVMDDFDGADDYFQLNKQTLDLLRITNSRMDASTNNNSTLRDT